MKHLKPHLPLDLRELLYSLNWYVYVNLGVLDLSSMRKYIGRYAKKPAIAETRITNYDGYSVTFFYKERTKTNPTFCTLTAQDFILKLIQHITPPQFRVIRYYGLLANASKKKFAHILSKLSTDVKKFAFYINWRLRQSKFKGLDPLLCPICGSEMTLKELASFSTSSGGLAYKFF